MNARVAPAILIVEDERIVAKDLQETLAEMGYNPFAIAVSADDALERASAKCPDIVLMDIRIKGEEDGISAAALLKRRFPVSIIYLTAHSDEGMLDRAKRTEPHGYLLKPVKPAELRSMIEITLYRRETEHVREQLRVTEHRLRAITDNVPVSIGYFDREGRLQFANRLFRDLVSYKEAALGMPANSFLDEALYKESYRHRQCALSGDQVSFVTQIERNGVPRKHEVTYLPDRDSNSTVVGVYALGYDVTEREQLGDQLEQARVDLETILNAVPAGITSWRVDLTNRFANRAAEAQFGIPSGHAPGMHLRQLMGEDRYQSAQSVIEAALAGRGSSFDHVDRLADDVLRYTHDEYVPELKRGAVVGMYAVSVDITEIRKSHEQIRELAQRLETIREEERRAVAVVLHDGIAQDLFATRLDVEHLATLMRGRSKMKQICQELSLAIGRCMDDTRQLANELRPVALASFNVAAVIKDHARRFEKQANLTINVAESEHFPKLDESAQLLFFRAAQEALTNVARHAQATTVDVMLRAEDGIVTMEIGDNGVGIVEAALNKPRSLGLLGIRERFSALDGGLTVKRREPTGTTFTVYLPLGAAKPPGH